MKMMRPLVYHRSVTAIESMQTDMWNCIGHSVCFYSIPMVICWCNEGLPTRLDNRIVVSLSGDVNRLDQLFLYFIDNISGSLHKYMLQSSVVWYWRGARRIKSFWHTKSSSKTLELRTGYSNQSGKCKCSHLKWPLTTIVVLVLQW